MLNYRRRMTATLSWKPRDVPPNRRSLGACLGRTALSAHRPSWGGGILGHGLAARLPLKRCEQACSNAHVAGASPTTLSCLSAQTSIPHAAAEGPCPLDAGIIGRRGQRIGGDIANGWTDHLGVSTKQLGVEAVAVDTRCRRAFGEALPPRRGGRSTSGPRGSRATRLRCEGSPNPT